MCCGKRFSFIINVIIPYSILCIFLLQIYSQYSTFITLRKKIDNQKDGRNSMTNYQLTKSKQYNFNTNEIQEYFENNALMKITFLKNLSLMFFNKLTHNKDNDIRVYMFLYLIIYDIICLIIVYLFIFGSIKSGFVKIFFQIFRFYFSAKRLKKFNNRIGLFTIINSKMENFRLYRGWSFFNPEGFLIIEFFCNFFIILDIILLWTYIYRRNKYRKMKEKNISNEKESEESSEESESKSSNIENSKKE